MDVKVMLKVAGSVIPPATYVIPLEIVPGYLEAVTDFSQGLVG